MSHLLQLCFTAILNFIVPRVRPAEQKEIGRRRKFMTDKQTDESGRSVLWLID
jgi:hypothetical protein